MNTLPDNSKGFAAEIEAGPIPGQSLARAPGSYPFEQPAQFSNPQEAMDALLEQITEEKAATRLLNMMDLGVPVYSIVYTMLMTGFTEGKWTPDTAMLLAEPLATFLFGMAKKAGIQAETGVQEEEDDLMELVAQKYDAEEASVTNFDDPNGFMEPI